MAWKSSGPLSSGRAPSVSHAKRVVKCTFCSSTMPWSDWLKHNKAKKHRNAVFASGCTLDEANLMLENTSKQQNPQQQEQQRQEQQQQPHHQHQQYTCWAAQSVSRGAPKCKVEIPKAASTLIRFLGVSSTGCGFNQFLSSTTGRQAAAPTLESLGRPRTGVCSPYPGVDSMWSFNRARASNSVHIILAATNEYLAVGTARDKHSTKLNVLKGHPQPTDAFDIIPCTEDKWKGLVLKPKPSHAFMLRHTSTQRLLAAIPYLSDGVRGCQLVLHDFPPEDSCLWAFHAVPNSAGVTFRGRIKLFDSKTNTGFIESYEASRMFLRDVFIDDQMQDIKDKLRPPVTGSSALPMAMAEKKAIDLSGVCLDFTVKVDKRGFAVLDTYKHVEESASVVPLPASHP